MVLGFTAKGVKGNQEAFFSEFPLLAIAHVIVDGISCIKKPPYKLFVSNLYGEKNKIILLILVKNQTAASYIVAASSLRTTSFTSVTLTFTLFEPSVISITSPTFTS